MPGILFLNVTFHRNYPNGRFGGAILGGGDGAETLSFPTVYLCICNTNFILFYFLVARGLLYKSSTDCLIQAIQGEGFMSLYKGFLPTWMRMVNDFSSFSINSLQLNSL